MSLDRSLRSANALVRHRNVLTRGERLDRLSEEEKWQDGKSPLGLPKVANRKVTVGKTEKAEATDDAAAPKTGATPAAPAGSAKGAAPAKAAAAPAAGAGKKK